MQVVGRWQGNTQFGGCIGLNVVKKLRHLRGVQLAGGGINKRCLVPHPNTLQKEFLAVVEIRIFLRRSRLPFNTGKPHPHHVVLRDASLLLLALDSNRVDPVAHRRKEGVEVGVN